MLSLLLGGDKGLSSRTPLDFDFFLDLSFDDGAWRTFFSETNPAFFSFSRSSNGL